MTNTNKLKAIMVERGYTQERLANALEISPTTLNYKLNNKREFLASEISKITHLLLIDSEQVSDIFFNEQVE